RMDYLVNPQGDRTTFTYDEANRIKLKQLANGARTSFTYDAAGRGMQLFHLNSSNAGVDGFGYDYDQRGNRIGLLEADGTRTTWTYDQIYQLLEELRPGSLGWVPLTLCDWVNMTLDEWTTMELGGMGVSFTHTYDPVGNRLVKYDGCSRTTYTYD